MVRGPGVKSNEIISDVVVNIDLAPTIVEMGGGEMEAVDGVSFLTSILQDTPPKAFIESNDIYLQNASKLFFRITKLMKVMQEIMFEKSL